MRFIDFFSGIGGFRIGMQQAGHKCIGHCEIDKYADISYRAMHTITDSQRAELLLMPLKERQVEIRKEQYLNGEWYADDITRIHPGDIPEADCWCFGFPCQDISIYGGKQGFEGSRSSLFFTIMHKLEQIEERKRPEWLFIENVRHLLSINDGWDFARLLIELDKAGYDAEWHSINSKNSGIPHNRERIYIVGHNRQYERGCSIFKGEQYRSFKKTDTQICSHCLLAKYPGNLNGTFIDDGIGIRPLTPKECFRLQGFPDEMFERAKQFNRNSHLYKQIGNSVTVPVIRNIAKGMSDE